MTSAEIEADIRATVARLEERTEQADDEISKTGRKVDSIAETVQKTVSAMGDRMIRVETKVDLGWKIIAGAALAAVVAAGTLVWKLAEIAAAMLRLLEHMGGTH